MSVGVGLRRVSRKVVKSMPILLMAVMHVLIKKIVVILD